MQCKVCDYRLWNLHSRACPECGTSFRPSEHEFAPNNVAFCCPHCDQDYYGTDAAGHLVPRTFDCVRCGERIDMDEMVLRPAEELEESQTRPDRNPWTDRSRTGWTTALFQTVGRSMVSPGRLMRVTPVEGSTAGAFGFASVIAAAVALLGGGLSLLPLLVMPIALGGGAGSAVSMILVSLATIVSVAFGSTLAGIVLWGLITHGMLWLIAKPTAGLGRTYQALCYAHGPMVVGAVPCVGWYLSYLTWIWWIVSAVLMVKDGQRVGPGRATFAVLTFPGLLVIGCVVLIAMAVMGVNQTVSQMNATIGVTVPTLTLATSLTTGAQAAGGALPAHAAEMITAGQLQPGDVIMPNSATIEGDVPIDRSTTLGDFMRLSPDRQRTLAQNATANLPPNDAPYRFGDVVFTHRGIDPAQHPADLWIAIVSPDPGTTPWDNPPREVGIVSLDGTSQTMSYQPFTQALQQENRRRAQLGLPPIPDPTTMQQVGAGVRGPTLPAQHGLP